MRAGVRLVGAIYGTQEQPVREDALPNPPRQCIPPSWPLVFRQTIAACGIETLSCGFSTPTVRATIPAMHCAKCWHPAPA